MEIQQGKYNNLSQGFLLNWEKEEGSELINFCWKIDNKIIQEA